MKTDTSGMYYVERIQRQCDYAYVCRLEDHQALNTVGGFIENNVSRMV